MRGLILFVFTLILFLTGCASLSEQEIADYTKRCEKETTIVVEPERTVIIEACVKERADDEREYRRVESNALFLEDFYRQEQACAAAGGMMVIERYFMRSGCARWKNCPPSRGDRYGCEYN